MNINMLSPYIRRAMPSVIPGGTVMARRIIFDYELIYVERGTVIVDFDDRRCVCGEGDFIFIRPGVPHILHFRDDVEVSQPHIHFDAVYDEYSPKVYVSYEDTDKIPLSDRRMVRKDIFPQFKSMILNITQRERFVKLFFRVIECYNAKEKWYELECMRLMLELLQMILEENGTEVLKTVESKKEIASIKAYIDANFRNIITLESLEKQFCYDRFYISRKFREFYKMPIMKYYDMLRVETAKELLAEGMRVSEVSETLNVSSVYCFSRFFKNKTGYPPAEHKKRLSNIL